MVFIEKLSIFPEKKKKRFCLLEGLVSEKGVDLYVDTITSVSQNFPDWTFGIIGSFKLGKNKTDGLFGDKIISKFKKIGPQAKYYGFKNQNFVEEKMKTAAIIIIPSMWQEPFGLVAAEAMSNGICIIASN